MFTAKRKGLLVFLAALFIAALIGVGIIFAPASARPASAAEEDTAKEVSSVQELMDAVNDKDIPQIKLTANITFDYTSDEEVYFIQGQGYSLKAAMDLIYNQADVDISHKYRLFVSRDLVLDLGTHTLTVITDDTESAAVIYNNNGGVKVTIKNGKLVGQSAGNFANIGTRGDGNSNVTLQDVDVEFTHTGNAYPLSDASRAAAIFVAGELNINNVSFLLKDGGEQVTNDKVLPVIKADIPQGYVTYATLQDEVNAAGTAATLVTLTKDYTENITISKGQNITLDLNEHSVYADSGYAIKNSGKLTVKDGTIERIYSQNTGSSIDVQNCTVTADSGNAVELRSSTKATINNSKITSAGDYGIYLYNLKGDAAQITNCTISGAKRGVSASTSKATISDCDIQAVTQKEGVKAYALNVTGSSNEIVVNNGSILKAEAPEATYEYAFSFNGGNLTLNDITVENGKVELYNSANVKIQKGTFKFDDVTVKGAGKFVITGGTFISENITDWFNTSWLVDGETVYALRTTQTENSYVVNEYKNDDTDAVCIGGYIVAVGGTNYTTWEEALTALKTAEDKTLKLLTSMENTLTVDADMTLALGVFNLSAADGAVIAVNDGATLTVTGSGKVIGQIEVQQGGNIVLEGGTYSAETFKIDWVAQGNAIAYDDLNKLYTVKDSSNVVATLTRGEKTYGFANLYTPFSADIIAAGETIVLQNDVSSGINLNSDDNGKEFTIDMNGYDIYGQFTIYAGMLNFVNNSVAKAVSTISHEQRIFQIMPEGDNVAELTLGENINVTAGTEAVFIQTQITNENLPAELDTLKPVAILDSSANITSNGGFAIVANGNGHGTEILIDGGSVKTTANAPAIYHPQYGTLTIKGGANIQGATGVEIRNGILNVEDATITATAKSFVTTGTPDGGGSTVTGAAIAVTKYNNSKVPLVVNVGNATLDSKAENGKALYEGYPDAEGSALPDGNTVEMTVDGAILNAPVQSVNEEQFIQRATFAQAAFEEGTTENYIAKSNDAGEAVIYYPVTGGGYGVGTVEDSKADGADTSDGNIAYNGTLMTMDEAIAAGAVAIIGSATETTDIITAYATLTEAVAAVPDETEDPVTVTLIGEEGAPIKGSGIGLFAANGDKKNIIIDFNGLTYDITGELVGSTGYESQGFHFERGNTVVLKNGTITSNAAIMLIQKYCDLTLEDIIIDGSNTNKYVVSNNAGTTTFTGNTQVIAAEGKFAFDVYYWPDGGYTEGVSVIFDENFTGKVVGKVEYTSDGTADGDNDTGWFEKAKLVFANGNSGTFDIELMQVTSENAENAGIEVGGGTFSQKIDENYMAEGLEMEEYNGSYIVVKAEADGITIAELINAQTEVRAYMAAFGLKLSDMQALSEDAAAAAVVEAYEAILAVSSQQALAEAKLAAMDAVDAFIDALNAAKADAVEQINAYAANEEEGIVTVPTYVLSAINGAASAAEVQTYFEAAKAEIDEVREQRAAAEEQANALAEKVAGIIEALKITEGEEGAWSTTLLGEVMEQLNAANADTDDILALIGQPADGDTNKTIIDMIKDVDGDIAEAVETITKHIDDKVAEFTGEITAIKTGVEALNALFNGAEGTEGLAQTIKDIEGYVDGIESSIGNLAEGETLASVLGDIDTAQGELKTALEQYKTSFESALKDIGGKFDDISAKIDDLPKYDEQFKTLTEAVSKVQTAVAAANDSLGSLSDNADSIKTTVEDMQTVQNSMNEAFKEFENTFATAMQTLGGRFDAVDKAVAALDTAIGALPDSTDAIAELKAALAEAQKGITAANEGIAQLGTGLATVEGKVDAIDSTADSVLAAQNALKTTLEGYKAAADEALADISESLAALDKDLAVLTARTAADKEALSKEIAALQATANKLEDAVAALDGDSQADLTAITEDLAGLQTSLDGLKADIQKVAQSVTAVEEDSVNSASGFAGLYVFISALVVLVVAVLVVVSLKKRA